MTPEKEHNPQEPVAVALTLEEWRTVLHWLQYGADYHNAKMHEWLAVCHDKKMGAAQAARHKKEEAQAEAVRKIIEGVLYPAPPPKTE